MRADSPSLTARGVLLARARLDRPSSPTGDPDAEVRLAAALAGEVIAPDTGRRRGGRGDLIGYIHVRTRFFDDAIVRAIDNGIEQIVILGAGYDCRALRFRTPGVHFFEVDHPATQQDKRERLAAIGASTEGVTFVAADFTRPGLAATLAAAGHDESRRSQFLCEGVLRYLPEEWFRELLRVAAVVSAPESELAVSISTRGGDSAENEARARFLAETGEPVLTVPPRDLALRWLGEARDGRRFRLPTSPTLRRRCAAAGSSCARS